MREVPRKFSQRQAKHDSATNTTELSDQGRWSLYATWLENDDAAIRANAIICLIHQANYLLDQQIAALERQFITEGGYSEQLASARLAQRVLDRSNSTDQSDQIPNCQRCNKPMVLRTAKQGKNAGQQFWGCSGYPDCKETTHV